MRILLIPALLSLVASCAWPPQAEGTAAAPAPPAAFVLPNPLELLFGPPPPAVAVAPAPPPAVPAVAAAPALSLPIPFLEFFAPGPGRLTLSNFSFDTAQVQAVVTTYPDCLVHEGTATTDFELPLNGTRIINPAPGSDVCWRRALGPGARPGGAPGEPGWTEWNRDYTSTGASIDARL